MTPKNTWRSYTQSCFPKGFTLIELLVVVLIIGILAAIAVPQYQKAVAKSRTVQTITTLRAMERALEVYMLGNNTLNACQNIDIDVDLGQFEECYCSRPGNYCRATINLPSGDGYIVSTGDLASHTWNRWCGYYGNAGKRECDALQEPLNFIYITTT